MAKAWSRIAQPSPPRFTTRASAVTKRPQPVPAGAREVHHIAEAVRQEKTATCRRASVANFALSTRSPASRLPPVDSPRSTPPPGSCPEGFLNREAQGPGPVIPTREPDRERQVNVQRLHLRSAQGRARRL